MVNEDVRLGANGGTYLPRTSYWPIATAASALVVASLIGLPRARNSASEHDQPLARSPTLEDHSSSLSVVEEHSPNYTEGRTGNVRQILLHASQGDEYSARSLLKDPLSKRSVHYLVSSQGTIYEMVKPKDTAWGAGSENACSISVMIEGVGGVTSAQRNSLCSLVLDIRKKYSGLPVHAYNRVENPVGADIVSSLNTSAGR